MDLSEQYDKIYRYCYFKVHHCQTAKRYYARNIFCVISAKFKSLIAAKNFLTFIRLPATYVSRNIAKTAKKL